MRKIVYPVLEGKIVERSVSKHEIAKKMHISDRALRLKLAGKSDFKWREVLIVQTFFPDMDILKIMQKAS